MATDQTILLCMEMVARAIKAAEPDIEPQQFTIQLFRGVALMINAGAREANGQLLFPAESTPSRSNGSRAFSVGRWGVPETIQ